MAVVPAAAPASHHPAELAVVVCEVLEPRLHSRAAVNRRRTAVKGGERR